MTGTLSRLVAAALLLTPLAAVPAAAESGAYVDLRPTRAVRLAAAAPGPEIPGVTYPRNAPPDLVAEHHPEPMATAAESPPAAEPAAAPQHAAEAASPSAPPPAAADALTVVTPVEKPAAPAITLRLEVDLATQRLTITERGEEKGVWPISSGRAGTPTTTGTFRPQWASRMWYSRQYDMAPMPHAVFFNGGIAFHATQATHLLGRPASHGCVRLSPQNARALFGLIHAHGYAHTEIVVRGPAQVANAEKRKPRPRGNGISSPAASNAGGSFWPFF